MKRSATTLVAISALGLSAQVLADGPESSSTGLPAAVARAECFRASVLVTVDGGTGSGTVVDPRGYVLTNHHVIAPVLAEGFDGPSVRDGLNVRVLLPDRTSREALELYEAEIVADDREHDFAFLRITHDATGAAVTGSPFTAIGVADGAGLETGTVLHTLGYPFGVRILTVLTGAVTGRRVEADVVEWLTIDAPFNPGNSGGSLVTDRCELVGIPTQVYRGGLNPVSMARPVDSRMRSFLRDATAAAAARGSSPARPADLDAPSGATAKPPTRGGHGRRGRH